MAEEGSNIRMLLEWQRVQKYVSGGPGLEDPTLRKEVSSFTPPTPPTLEGPKGAPALEAMVPSNPRRESLNRFESIQALARIGLNRFGRSLESV